jgi:ankyrin repeat protein
LECVTLRRFTRGATYDIIKALVDAGADPKAKDKAGITPAEYANHWLKKITASYIEQFYETPINQLILLRNIYIYIPYSNESTIIFKI